MRLADMIRGMEVTKHSAFWSSPQKEASRVEKLLRSAIANWEKKTNKKLKTEALYNQDFVDGGATLKRITSGSGGRGY